jgi:superoxide dismutase, Cu-Zn family
MMKKTVLLLVTLLLIASAAGAYAQSGGVKNANVILNDVKGRQVGTARLTEGTDGLVQVVVQVRGLSPGEHGIHFHENGTCSPTFAAAGAHFNPLGRHHGLQNPKGSHAGDLPNMKVDQNGYGYLNTVTELATLSPGVTSLLGGNGRTLVIHAGTDDQVTDPSGNSGDRVACGVIRAT